MSKTYPQDSSARKIGTKGRQLVFSSFNANRWDFHEKTGGDYGVDAELEYSNNGEFRNEKFECQIKATTKAKFIDDGKSLSFSNFPVKTLNYALNSRIPFFLLIADVTKSLVYFLLITDKFVPSNGYDDQLTVTVHIPASNCVQTNEGQLIKEMMSFYE